MIKSNRSFGITKLKNNIKTIDSFIYNEEKNLIILTSIGRIFKFNLSNKFLTPTTKQLRITLANFYKKKRLFLVVLTNEKIFISFYK